MKINVKIHASARETKVIVHDSNTLEVYVTRPATNNQANLAAIEALANHFQVKKSQVVLVKGTKSRNKTFLVLNN